jgi:hypothetical protein
VGINTRERQDGNENDEKHDLLYFATTDDMSLDVFCIYYIKTQWNAFIEARDSSERHCS